MPDGHFVAWMLTIDVFAPGSQTSWRSLRQRTCSAAATRRRAAWCCSPASCAPAVTSSWATLPSNASRRSARLASAMRLYFLPSIPAKEKPCVMTRIDLQQLLLVFQINGAESTR